MLDADFMEAARRLIAADSVTHRGNLRAVEVLEPLCRAAGLEARRLPAPDSADRDANLLAGPGGGREATGSPLLLVTHLDTVDAGPRELWRTDPFTLTVRGDIAYGLGVADVKLDALAKLWAARRLRDVPLARPFYFLGTYGEEAGLRGARAFVEDLPFQPAYVLCGEPSELRLYLAHKGYAVVRVTLEQKQGKRVAAGARTRVVVAGKAAHSSTPQLGVNAADRALELSTKLGPVLEIDGGASTNTIPSQCRLLTVANGPSLPPGDRSEDAGDGPEAFDLAPLLRVCAELRDVWRSAAESLEPHADLRFEPHTAVANLTRIEGAAGRVTFTLDARLLPAHDPHTLLAGFELALRNVVPEGVHASMTVERASGGMNTPEDAELIRISSGVLARMGLDGRPRAKPTSTEGGVFAQAGFQAAVFGPSLSTGNAHTANEHARLNEVERAIDLYEALIRELCLSPGEAEG